MSTDFSRIESSKENILPLRSGRKAESLTKVEESQTARFAAEAVKIRMKFESDIANYVGDDPLELYIQYINWTKESFPGNNISSGLVDIIQRCVSALKDVPAYKNDRRFVSLWLFYSENVKKPVEVFQFMEANQIGVLDYLFYNSYGRVLEDQKEFDRVDKVYQAGIDRKAQPEEKMRDLQTAFQARMWKRMQQQQDQQQEGLVDEPSATSSDRENLRTPLGTLRGPSSVRSYDSGSRGLGAMQPPSATSSSRKRPAQSSQAGESRSNVGLPVYVDDEFVSEEDRQRRGPMPKMAPAAMPGWAQLPTEAERHKENTDKATKWTGVTLPSSGLSRAAGNRFTGGGSSGPAPAFEVFQDEDSAPVASTPSQPKSSNVLKARLEDSSSTARRAEELLANPLKLSYKFTVKTEKYERQDNELKPQKGGGYEKWMFDASLVYPGDGLEYSLEEIRANKVAAATPVAATPKSIKIQPIGFGLPGGGVVDPIAGVPAPMRVVKEEPHPEPTPVQNAVPQTQPMPIRFSPSELLLGQSPLETPQAKTSPFTATSPTQTPTLKEVMSKPVTFAPESGNENAPTNKKLPFGQSQPAMAGPSTQPVRSNPLAFGVSSAPLSNSFDEGVRQLFIATALPSLTRLTGAVMGMFSDVPEESEPTRSLVTGLIVPPAPQTGFTVFEEHTATLTNPAAPQPAKQTGFAVFDDSACQENVPPPNTSNRSALVNRTTALAPIEDGSVAFDPMAKVQFEPSDPTAQPHAAFPFASPICTNNGGLSMDPLLATSPLVQFSPPSSQASHHAMPAHDTEASFAVTPNSSFTARVAAAKLSPSTQRVLFDEGDTIHGLDGILSPGTLDNTRLNSGRSALSPPRKKRDSLAADFTIGPGELTGNFDATDISVNLHGLTAEFKELSLARSSVPATAAAPAVATVEDSQDEDDDSVVSVPLVRLNTSQVVDISRFDRSLWSHLKERGVGQGDSVFVDASAQNPPAELARLQVGSIVSIDCRNLQIQRLMPSEGPNQVAVACDAIDKSKLFVVKVALVKCPWEYYCARRLSNKISATRHKQLMNFESVVLYNNSVVELMPFNQLGNIEEVLAGQGGQKEPLVTYYASQTLELLEEFHQAGFIHGGVTTRAFTILNQTIAKPALPGTPEWYFRSPKCIHLGTAVDLEAFPAGTKFQFGKYQQVKTEWGCEYDLISLADFVHSMLFGKPLELKQENGAWKMTSTLKSFWDTKMWTTFFETCLRLATLPAGSYSSQMLRPLKSALEQGIAGSAKLRSIQAQLTALKKL